MSGIDWCVITSAVWRRPGCCLSKARMLLTEERDGFAWKWSLKTAQLTPCPSVPRLLESIDAQYLIYKAAKLLENKSINHQRGSYILKTDKKTIAMIACSSVRQIKCTYKKCCLIRFGLVSRTSLKIPLAWGRKWKSVGVVVVAYRLIHSQCRWWCHSSLNNLAANRDSVMHTFSQQRGSISNKRKHEEIKTQQRTPCFTVRSFYVFIYRKCWYSA